MLHLANEANYLSESIKHPETKKLTHAWFTHPEAVKMFKAWPNVILIDSTYKTNKYGLILAQCVGVTPIGKSFLIGYALIENEGTEGYKWVFRRLESLLEPGVRPTVIVTDHEHGLIAALPAYIWKRADVMIHGQHIEIRKMLEDSISKTIVTNMYYENIFSMFSGRVSATAIEAMLVEYNRGTDLGYYLEENCGCILWTTHKLLCACRLHTVFHEGKRIHPDDLHVFWSRLAYTDSSHRRSRHNDVMEDHFDKVRASHHSVQRDVIESLFTKLYPEDKVMGPPPFELNYDYVTDVGLFDYQHCMPEAVIDGFLEAFDPEGDGHCGFQVMSLAKTGNQRNYLEMRQQLLVEYVSVYYGDRNSAYRRIKWAHHKPCQKPNWMEALDLHAFAILFNWTICFVTVQPNLSGDRVWTGSNTD
ncbi:uncharacterized protein LOC141588684 [Silene latifolia]|uniref:uncharacterized protein LOC141588684 n=1 Tax=Silene latifolia TaxID=37657 RepID=UPI003D7864C9